MAEHHRHEHEDERHDETIHLDYKGPLTLKPGGPVTVNATHSISEDTKTFLREIFPPPRILTTVGFSRFEFREDGIIVEGDIRKIMAQVNQTGDATASFVNRHGMPVTVAAPEWSSSDESVATVVGDGLTGHITTLAEGDTVILCRNPDPDNDPLTDGALDVTGALAVRPDNVAVGGSMTFGEFTDIP